MSALGTLWGGARDLVGGVLFVVAVTIMRRSTLRLVLQRVEVPR